VQTVAAMAANATILLSLNRINPRRTVHAREQASNEIRDTPLMKTGCAALSSYGR
jgi:hypothetical protein